MYKSSALARETLGVRSEIMGNERPNTARTCESPGPTVSAITMRPATVPPINQGFHFVETASGGAATGRGAELAKAASDESEASGTANADKATCDFESGSSASAASWVKFCCEERSHAVSSCVKA